MQHNHSKVPPTAFDTVKHSIRPEPSFLKQCRRKVSWPNLKYYTDVHTEAMRKTTTILSRWSIFDLTLILLTWRIWWVPNNASKWQIGFNLAFEGLTEEKRQGNLSQIVNQTCISIIIIIVYLSWIWATCWPVLVSRIQKSLQRSAMIPSASWRIEFHYPG